MKAFHTLAWFIIEGCMVYVLYAGIRGQSDRRAGAAASVVALETLVFAANGFHCPLTAVARNLGDNTGSVTDIYLPPWLSRNLPAIHVPLILIAAALHWRNLAVTSRRLKPRRIALGSHERSRLSARKNLIPKT
ncbi:hypothetical protein [Paenarthrobacter sp. NPDC091669]|uniref:hypothetical protein n=1 Tax=Paenarthrobacter sp. NPDC091669 TaxID=3364384 RepID=UPI003802484A